MISTLTITGLMTESTLKCQNYDLWESEHFLHLNTIYILQQLKMEGLEGY